MKMMKLALVLAFAVAAGCGSTPPPPEEGGGGGGATGGDKQKDSEENAARAAEHYDLAVKAESSGDYMKARDELLKVQTYQPDYKDTGARLKNLAEVIDVQQRLDGAPSGDPRKADIMVEYACALRKRGELDRAIDAIQKALQQNPTLAAAHAELSTVDFEAGLVKESLDQANKAIESDPASADGYYELAFLHRTQQVEGADPSKALEYAQKAASLSKPNDWKAHELVAACYHDSGEMEKALGALKEAVRASGGLPRLQKKYEAWGGKPDAPPPPPEKPPETPPPPAEKPPETPPPPAEKPPETPPPPAEKPPEMAPPPPPPPPAETPPPPPPPAETPPPPPPAETPKNDMGGGDAPKEGGGN